jgi:DNA repair protein RadA/Sms
MVEFKIPARAVGGKSASANATATATATANKGGRLQSITDIAAEHFERITVGLPELERVLGGGFVPGSLVLVGGEPGIGKSTLLMQVAAGLDQPVIYVSGEESAAQLRLRAERLSALKENLFILTGTDVSEVVNLAVEKRPALLIVDSVQTLTAPDAAGLPGSIVQVRACAGSLMQFAKETGIPVVLIGHITKSGSLAGPKILEHMVDTVLYFEGEAQFSYRVLRAFKNRFGSTNEIALFEMTDRGMRELTNPSELFLSGRALDVAGSAVVVAMEGTRPILVEIQALAAPNTTGGYPRRLSTGVDPNRTAVMLAVLEKRLHLGAGNVDVYVQAIGGFRLSEPAADIGIMGAIASSLRDRPIPHGTAGFGEIGLSGEVRGVSKAEIRTREAVRLGFKKVVVPNSNLGEAQKAAGTAIKVAAVGTVMEALAELLTE